MDSSDPDVIKSSYLFTLNNMKVEYETKRFGFQEWKALDNFKDRLPQLGIRVTFYDRLPKVSSEMVVKFIDRIRQKDGGSLYFFAYKNYDLKLEHYQEILRTELRFKPELRVRYLACVPVGALFGFEKDVGLFVRVRVISMNLKTRDVKYWAVDEGFFGDCKVQELIFLNDFCLSLDILAVPGVMRKGITSMQKHKISQGKLCKVTVKEPILSDDAGPRKLRLIEFIE